MSEAFVAGLVISGISKAVAHQAEFMGVVRHMHLANKTVFAAEIGQPGYSRLYTATQVNELLDRAERLEGNSRLSRMFAKAQIEIGFAAQPPRVDVLRKAKDKLDDAMDNLLTGKAAADEWDLVTTDFYGLRTVTEEAQPPLRVRAAASTAAKQANG